MAKRQIPPGTRRQIRMFPPMAAATAIKSWRTVPNQRRSTGDFSGAQIKPGGERFSSAKATSASSFDPWAHSITRSQSQLRP
jgi:hypothetical protein